MCILDDPDLLSKNSDVSSELFLGTVKAFFCIKCVCLHSETICIIVNKSARHNGNGHNDLNLSCVYLHSQTLRIILNKFD